MRRARPRDARAAGGTTPGVEVLDGTAEAMPLPDGSVDAVTVAQAFHWFAFDGALAEIAGVLRPGGGLSHPVQPRDERTPWVERWNDVIEWHSRLIAATSHRLDRAAGRRTASSDLGHADIEWDQP